MRYLPYNILLDISKRKSAGKDPYTIPEEMLKVLEKERKERYLQTIPETVRVILSEQLRKG
jgi:hypothetical protein